MASLKRTTLQHRVWRWHFFAGLMVIPFAVILAATGGLYLFKPQYEAAVERAINARAVLQTGSQEALSADEIVSSVLKSYPQGQFRRLTLPRNAADRTFEAEFQTITGLRILWVDQYTGAILHDTRKSARLMNIAKNIHGNLMAGKWGSYFVELAACWMIVLIITGIYLWWPRGQSWRRLLLPQLKSTRRREKLRQLHGVGGTWIGGMVLLLLLSGLPWTQIWGAGFDRVCQIMGWDGPGQEWFVTLNSAAPNQRPAISHDDHADHNAGAAQKNPALKQDGLNLWQRTTNDEGVVHLKSSVQATTATPLPLEAIVTRVQAQHLAYPVEIQPPKGDNGVWTIRSMTPNRPQRVTVHYDRWTGDEIMRIDFADRHPVQQVTSYGIALHEGALFGWLNQALGLIAALGVIALCVTGGWMWLRRRPAGAIGAPPMPVDPKIARGVIILIIALAAFLPLLAASLILAWISDRCWQGLHIALAQK